MSTKTQHLHRYTKKELPLKHLKVGKTKCPVCGFPYILKTPTGNGAIYAHRNEWYHQVRDEK